MTAIAKKRIQSRIARHERVRKSVVGTAECPRLAVRRSLSHMIAQIFDDENNVTSVFTDPVTANRIKNAVLLRIQDSSE